MHFPTVDYDATTFPDFEEERLYNFEIGSKGVYANGRGTYSAALYYMIYENMVGAENLNWNDTNINGWNESNWTNFTAERTWLNNGDGEFYGLELATSFSINDTWTVGGYITLAEAKYTDFCSIQAPNYRDAPGGPAGGGNTLIPILRPENGDDVLSACGVVDGNTLPRHANISGNLNLRANLRNPVFGMRTSLRADVRYKGPYYEDHMNLFERKAVATVNLSATMRKENWNFRFFINNVTDVNEPQRISVAQYYTNRPIPIVAPVQEGSYAVNPRRPREIGLQATYNF